MQIQELVKLIRRNKFNGISGNSKTVKKGFIFVAVKGARLDGNKFIKEAIDKGAKVIVGESKDLRNNNLKDILTVPVKDTRKAIAKLAVEFYKNPSDKIKVVGVTGTNGKTTITYLIEELLRKSGHNPGVIGTINYRYNNMVIPAKNTTPGPIEIQSIISDMQNRKVDYLAMEVSSHALDQSRVLGVNFHSAIFTNLTQDHLDYHKTLNNYFLSKAKLFTELSRKAFCVINNDDKFAVRLKKMTPAKVITYGIRNKSSVMARDIKFNVTHTEFLLITPRGEIRIRTSLIGIHNVYNILATCAWGLEAGIKLSKIQSAISDFKIVPGRLERINTDKGFSIFVDYAHTDDALKNVIGTLRHLHPKRIITVFGCGGERDKLKRPKMGKVATALSDFAIITSDNPRSENPKAIIEDVLKGIENTNYCTFVDRFKAIKKALSLARAGDIVLVAGKGHEDYQVLNTGPIPFDDRKVVRECLRFLS